MQQKAIACISPIFSTFFGQNFSNIFILFLAVLLVIFRLYFIVIDHSVLLLACCLIEQLPESC